ncbi:hypothetical protein SCH4B_4384 [Ruegeria sp. TrichCH4B]|nr:hypothetical protein SCH4B_4384 [Ruegeria sp. TrichCH4B]
MNDLSDENLNRSIPSPDEVEKAKTQSGGWKRETLQNWGVSWPPPKGWRARLKEQWEHSK